MKTLLVILTLFFLATVAGQSPYAKLDNEFRSLFDPVPINKGQEQYFYKYALKLYKEDSLQKAGQIFDRVYWLDTASSIGQKAFQCKKQIEQAVIQKAKINLNSIWYWDWSGTNWGETDSPKRSGKTKRIELNGTKIYFYQNDTLIRQTSYLLTQTFNWQYGLLLNRIRYLDNNEEWHFTLASINAFTSSRLWIVEVSQLLCGNYGEAYSLKVSSPLLTKNSR